MPSACETLRGPAAAALRAGLSAAEQEAYEVLEEMGEADARSLARELGKSRNTVRKTLLRLRAKGQVATKEIRATQEGGKKVLFHIPGTNGAEPKD